MSNVAVPDMPILGARDSGSLEPDEVVDSNERECFLGVDGGGTKTHAVVTDSRSRVLGEGFSGGSNPLRVGLDDAISNLQQAISQACADAGIRRRDITAACLGIAGVSHPIHYETMKNALERRLDLKRLELVTDARAALAGALDGEPGVVIIAGTGSIAMGVNGSGEEARSGGWGPTFGDEGSGFDIARHALQAVAASFDERLPQTILTGRVCQRLGISSAADLPGVIYNSDSEPVEIASLADLVTDAAREGDEVAKEILAEAGVELAGLVASVIEKLGMQEQPFGVAYVGSVFRAGDLVLDSFKTTLGRVAPKARVRAPVLPPAVGAAKLAEVYALRGKQ